MAAKAGIISVAAFEFDRNHIQLRMPMHAPGLIVNWFAIDVDSVGFGSNYRKHIGNLLG